MFFKDVICHLTDYCMAWFPLVDLSSCEVMGDFNYRHIPPRTYHVVHLPYEIRLRQLQSLLQRNTEFQRWVTPYDEEVRVITGNIFLQRMMRYS